MQRYLKSNYSILITSKHSHFESLQCGLRDVVMWQEGGGGEEPGQGEVGGRRRRAHASLFVVQGASGALAKTLLELEAA